MSGPGRVMLAATALAAVSGALYGALLYDRHTDKSIATSEMAGRISGVMQAFHAEDGTFGYGDKTLKVKMFDDESGPGAAYEHPFGGDIRVIADGDRFTAFINGLTPMACRWMLKFREAGQGEPSLIGHMVGPAGVGIVSTQSSSGCREGALTVTYEPVPGAGGAPV